MRLKLALLSCLLMSQAVFAHGPEPLPLQGVPIPPVPGLLDGADPVVVNKDKAIALGKALFWDMNVGSDGMACGSCHFHAGVDIRTKNQLDSGAKSSLGTGNTFEQLPSGSAGGANHTLTSNDFPLYQFNDPLEISSGKIFSTDDVVSSAGTFSGAFGSTSKFTGSTDTCNRSQTDPVFHVGSVNTRRVEPRNVPTMINAIFNYRNFWDGRANNVFNGSSPWGDRDPQAGVWIKTGARSVVKQPLHLINSSLASLSVAPPLSDTEMACSGRVWPAIGRKLLLRQPLQGQKVHHQDSVFAAQNLVLSTPAEQKPGLNTTYKTLVTQAFNPKYWSYTRTGEFGAPSGQVPYNQMEANFSMFFGIALQLYQATLISDQAPIDLTDRFIDLDRGAYVPTWTFPAETGIVYDEAKKERLTRGEQLFIDNHCNLCHAGPTLTTATVDVNSKLVTTTADATEGDGIKKFGPANFRIPFGPDSMGPNGAASAAGITPSKNVVQRDITVNLRKLMDMGFFNTGVNDLGADPGVAGFDDFGNPLSFTQQYYQYLLGNYSAIKDSDVLTNVRSCDFIHPLGSVALPIFLTPDVFQGADIQVDGSREGVLRNQNCLSAQKAYIPTIAAANAAINTSKMAVANTAAFKVPSLRNIELTGPYMHNGSMATLEQVVEFYSRRGNVVLPENTFQHNLVNAVSLGGESPEDRAAVVEFMKTFTDDRVRYEKAPFDHPQVIVPHGHTGDSNTVTAGNPIAGNLAKDEMLDIPAVGANGAFESNGITPKGLEPFEHYLAP